MLELASEKSRVHLSGNHKACDYISVWVVGGAGWVFLLVLAHGWVSFLFA
jgi:hypothetical protein